MKQKGFTLIELLVVIAIIGLLLSIIIPSLKAAKSQASRLACAANLNSLGKAIKLYAENNDNLLMPNLYKTGDGTAYKSYGIGYILHDFDLGPEERFTDVFGWGYLYTSNLIDQGEVFYCPSAPKITGGQGAFEVSFNYEFYSGGPGWPWNNDPSGWNDFYVRSSFQYLPQNGNTKVTVVSPRGYGSGKFPEIATKSSQLYAGHVMACDILYSIGHLPHKKGKNGSGVNVLYADGSVDFSNNADAFDRSLWPEGVAIGDDEYLFRKVVSLLK